jgi:hypothetical protein
MADLLFSSSEKLLSAIEAILDGIGKAILMAVSWE